MRNKTIAYTITKKACIIFICWFRFHISKYKILQVQKENMQFICPIGVLISLRAGRVSWHGLWEREKRENNTEMHIMLISIWVGSFSHMTFENVAITMEIFGIDWCKAIKETIFYCHKHSANTQKRKTKRETNTTRNATTEKWKTGKWKLNMKV